MSSGLTTESDLDACVEGMRWRRTCCVAEVISVLATRVTLFHVSQGGEEESVVRREQRPSDQSDLDSCITGRWEGVLSDVSNGLATRVSQGGEEESVVWREQRPSDQNDLDSCVAGRWGVCYTVRKTSLFCLLRDLFLLPLKWRNLYMFFHSKTLRSTATEWKLMVSLNPAI